MEDDMENDTFESYPRYFIITLNNKYDILEKEQPSVSRYVTECLNSLDNMHTKKSNSKSLDCTGHLLDIPLEEIYIIFYAGFYVNYSNNTMKVFVKYREDMLSGDRILNKTYDIEPDRKFSRNKELKDQIINDIESQPEKSFDDEFYW